MVYDSLQYAATLHGAAKFAQESHHWDGSLGLRYMPYSDINIKSGTIAVVSIASCEHTWDIFRQLSNGELLFIAITEADCPRLPPSVAVSVPLTQLGRELSQLLLDLRSARYIQWLSAAVICDHTIDGAMIESLVHSLSLEVFDEGYSSRSALTTVYTIQPAQTDWQRRANVFDVMSNLPKLEDNSNFLVVIKFDLIGIILDVVKELKLLRPECQWLFVVPRPLSRVSLHDFMTHLPEGANVAFLHNSSHYHHSCTGGVKCHASTLLQSLLAALDTAARAERLKAAQVSQEEWQQIKPSSEEHRRTLLQYIQKQIGSEVLCDNCTEWRVLAAELWGREFTNFRPGSERLLEAGYWSPRQGCQLTDQLFPHSEYGFRKLRLTVASFHNPPWQIINYNSSGHPVEFKGVVFEIVNFLSKKYNFTYDVVIPFNVSYLPLNSTEGSASNISEHLNSHQDSALLLSFWDKISTLVKEKKIFLGACAFTIYEDKLNLVNFSDPVSIESYVFLVSRPKELSRALLFVLPFASDAWLCIVFSIALMAPVLYYVHRLSPFYEYHGFCSHSGLGRIANCFWYVYGALLQQGGVHLPIADSGRLVVGTWWLVVLVVVTTYCGNLVAFLTFPKMDRPVTSVMDLLERKHLLTWGLPDRSYAQTLLMTAEEPILREMFNLAQLHRQVTPAVVEAVRAGKHAFIQSHTKLLYLMKEQYLATNTCDFILGNEEFLYEKLGMIMSLDNPYLELFNEEIGRLHRTGLIHKWLVDYLPMRDRCWARSHTTQANNHTVNLDDMQGCFFILFLGIFLSTVIIVVELLIKKHLQARQQRVIEPFIH